MRTCQPEWQHCPPMIMQSNIRWPAKPKRRPCQLHFSLRWADVSLSIEQRTYADMHSKTNSSIGMLTLLKQCASSNQSPRLEIGSLVHSAGTDFHEHLGGNLQVNRLPQPVECFPALCCSAIQKLHARLLDCSLHLGAVRYVFDCSCHGRNGKRVDVMIKAGCTFAIGVFKASGARDRAPITSRTQVLRRAGRQGRNNN